jgi:hypothetical protein
MKKEDKEQFLSLDDIVNIGRNFNNNDDDLELKLENNGGKEIKIVTYPKDKGVNWKDKLITIGTLWFKVNDRWSEAGCVILADDKLVYLLSIYEIHGYQFFPERDLLVVYGHETVLLLWLDIFQLEDIYTH